ncbi:MAG TPA: hypothetical protein VF896_04790, partial [Anaerolineales bacterium]
MPVQNVTFSLRQIFFGNVVQVADIRGTPLPLMVFVRVVQRCGMILNIHAVNYGRPLMIGIVKRCQSDNGSQSMPRFIENLRNDKSTLTLLALAAIKLLIHLLTSDRYGYFRDEFYYIAASKRLAFGYVDFPPFIALLTRLVRETLGESLLALHLFPALAGAILVFLTG